MTTPAPGKAPDWWLAARRWYPRVCVLAVNTALAMMLVLLLTDWTATFLFAFRPPTVYSRQLKAESFTLTPPEVVRDVFREYDRMGATESFTFTPWTTFMHREFSGRYLNVLRYNHLYNHRKTALPPARPGARPLTVWAFGGSTMFGWGLPDDQTIASWLARELAERFPDRAVRVLNFAEGSYFSSLEVAQYVALLRTGPPPDVALFLDGHNDVYNLKDGREVPGYWVLAGVAWERERERRVDVLAPWIELTAGFPPFKLARYYRLASKGHVGIPVEDRYAVASRDPVAQVAAAYGLNRHLIVEASGRMGIDVYCFLQPVAFYDDESPAARDAARRSGDILYLTYERLVEEATAGRSPAFHSLHDVLRGVREPRVDSAHYSDHASRRIAARMAEVIAARKAAAR